MKKTLILVLTAALAMSVAGAAHAGRATTVFEDPVGDAGIYGGSAVGENPLPAFDQGGFDLVSGEIARAGDNLEFTVTSAAMPPTGSLPDGATFRWYFQVGYEAFLLSIKSQDIGKPNLITGQGTDRVGSVDVDGHFRLERCTGGGSLPGGFPIEGCDLIALEEGSFDPPSKSFTVSIPLEDLEAASGSVLRSYTSTGCQPCWIVPTVDRTVPAGFMIDGVNGAIKYRIPNK
jgi:hypothetical protein